MTTTAVDELADDLGFGDYDSDEGYDDDDDDVEHDQLPNVDEYKAQMGHTANTNRGNGNSSNRPPPTLMKSICVACCAFILVTIIIVVSVTVFEEEKDKERYASHSKDYPWVYGRTDRYLQFREYVSKVRGLTPMDVFLNQEYSSTTTTTSADALHDSPQYLALQWLAHGDGMKMQVPQEPFLDVDERYAMAVLYFAMDGPKWNVKFNFLSDTHICNWKEGISESGGLMEEIYGVAKCDVRDDGSGDQYPVQFALPRFTGISGTIPDEVRGLIRLESFRIGSNVGLGGSLPDGVRRMTSLTHFFVEDCSLSGVLPTWIGELTRLEELVLSGNGNMNGQLPTTELKSLTKLRQLSLDGNQFGGTIIEALQGMTTLSRLHLDNNQFEGPISASWLDSLPLLHELDISDNSMSGVLPSNLFTHVSLQVVDLHGNDIAGELPTMEGGFNNTSLKLLSLQDNKLTGTLPPSMSHLMGLKRLDLSSNHLEGRLIPESWGPGMVDMEFFHIGWNDGFDEGPIPDTVLSSWTKLRELTLAANSINGTIPESLFTSLTQLQFLNLYANSLTGTIPTTIGLLSNLHYLFLKRNDLIGEIPSDLESVTTLQFVSLEQNELNGTMSGIFCANPPQEINILGKFKSLQNLTMDCEEENLDCPCCTVCCKSSEVLCNNQIPWQEMHSDAHPSWRDGGYFPNP